MPDFKSQVAEFNRMYRLPVENLPTLEAVGDATQRIKNFVITISAEVTEKSEVLESISNWETARDVSAEAEFESRLDALVSLADWLGDLQIFCASEMAKFGLPLYEILGLIMTSNFTKLGADGNPIYDETGKVQKGPNYRKPEPMIKEYLRGLLLTSENSFDSFEGQDIKPKLDSNSLGN